MPYAVIKNQNRRNGCRKRKGNPEEKLSLGTAIDFRRLIQLFRNIGFEKGSCHNHVVYAQAAGQDQRHMVLSMCRLRITR